MKYNPAEWMQKIGIPQDVLSDTPILEIQNFEMVHITNYTGIAELTAEQVRILVRNGEYIIEGAQFVICNATYREIVIQGNIQSLKFKRKAGSEGC